MKTLTTLVLLCITLLSGSAYAHASHDTDYSYDSTTKTLLINAVLNQTVTVACASAARTGIAAPIVKVRMTVMGKIVTVTCK